MLISSAPTYKLLESVIN